LDRFHAVPAVETEALSAGSGSHYLADLCGVVALLQDDGAIHPSLRFLAGFYLAEVAREIAIRPGCFLARLHRVGVSVPHSGRAAVADVLTQAEPTAAGIQSAERNQEWHSLNPEWLGQHPSHEQQQSRGHPQALG
jgi:hypothetical protein